MGVLQFLTIICTMGIGVGAFETLLKHRRQMAEIRQGGKDAAQASTERIAALERQIADLTALVHQQTIALDGMGMNTDRELRNRVGV